MLTQALAGIPKQDTTVWLVYYAIRREWDASNWKGIGQQALMLAASTVKLDSPEQKVQVELKNA